jgi:hypothetical protein
VGFILVSEFRLLDSALLILNVCHRFRRRDIDFPRPAISFAPAGIHFASSATDLAGGDIDSLSEDRGFGLAFPDLL